MIYPEQKKKLKKLAHALKPVVILGAKGLTDAVLAEINQALEHHELIKIKIPSENQGDFQEQAHAICEATQADIVQTIGHVLAIYRKSTKK